MENKTDMKHGFLSRIPRRAAAALALALLMILPAQALGDIEVRYLLQGMGALVPVPGTQYLLAQEQGGDLWGVYNTSGDKLIDCQFDRLTYLNHGWFQDALGDEPLDNWKALVSIDGSFVSDYRYGMLQAYSAQWAVGLVLSEGTAEAYDLSPEENTFYTIDRCDVFCLNGKPHLAGSLSREQFRQAAAHGDYLSVEDALGGVTVYDRELRDTGLAVSSVSEAVYGIYSYALMDKAAQEIILDGFTEAKAFSTAQGLVFQVTRVDFSGKKHTGLCDAEGNWLIPLGDLDGCSLAAVNAEYAVVVQNKLRGLYSFSAGRMVVPCAYQSIITNAASTDPYTAYGYACAANGNKREYIRLDTGEVTRAITFNKSKMKALGGTLYRSIAPDTYRFWAADGKEWITQDYRIIASRGDGRLIVLQQIESGAYGVMTMDGEVALNFWYRNTPVITDDGKVILNTQNNGACLAELTW